MSALALVLAVATAASFGAADFLGGLASRRAPVLPVVLLSQLVAAALLALALVVAWEEPTAQALRWGTAAGVAAGVAFIAYYRGLSIGRMGLVATVTAVCSALVPVAVGVTIGGERPTALAVVGVVVALAAVVLLSVGLGPTSDGGASPAVAVPAVAPVARSSDRDRAAGQGALRSRPPPGGQLPGPPGLVEGLVAGGGYGGFFVFIERTGAGSTIWPLLAATGATLLVVAVLVLLRRVDVRSALPARRLVVATGVLQITGGLAVLLSVRAGPLSLVAVVVALSPVPTMVLARVFLAEHLTPQQVVGIVLALVGVAMIAGG